MIRTNTAVPLVFLALDASGNRVTGLTTITAKVMRPTDGQVWDWAGSAFSATPSSATTTLTEISVSNMPGYYSATWPGTGTEGDYISEIVPPSGLTADDRPVAANLIVRDYPTATAVADLSARLPAALVSGRIDASVGAMAANTFTASAAAADAVTEIASAVDAAVTASHGSGSYATATGFAVPGSAMTLTSGERTTLQALILSDATPFQGARIDAAVSSRASQASVDALPTVAGIADAVLDEALSGHATAGTAGAALALLDVAVSTRATAAGVWAVVTSNTDWTYGSSLVLLRKHVTNRLEVTTDDDGTETLYDDDGETAIVTQSLRDGSNGSITTPTGSPALRGAAA